MSQSVARINSYRLQQVVAGTLVHPFAEAAQQSDGAGQMFEGRQVGSRGAIGAAEHQVLDVADQSGDDPAWYDLLEGQETCALATVEGLAPYLTSTLRLAEANGNGEPARRFTKRTFRKVVCAKPLADHLEAGVSFRAERESGVACDDGHGLEAGETMGDLLDGLPSRRSPFSVSPVRLRNGSTATRG